MKNFARINRAAAAGVIFAASLSSVYAAADPSDDAAKVNSLAAAVIGVSDIETALVFYTSVLGLKLVGEVNTEKYLERILAAPNGEGSRVVLFESLTEAIPSETRLVFYTDDAQGVVEAFRARGLDVIHEPATFPGTSVIVGIARDEDGTQLEFIQLPNSSD